MTRRRRILILAALIVIAAVMAYPLRITIQTYVVAPLSMLWFYLVYYYHVIPQQFFWFLILLAAAYISFGDLVENPFKRRKIQGARSVLKGQVEMLAYWIDHSNQGVYSRWKVARMLGLLAAGILELRGNSIGRKKTLRSRDWTPPADIQDYLEAGLFGSYADYPLKKRNTPFAVDVDRVVEFLESQLEMNRDNNK